MNMDDLLMNIGQKNIQEKKKTAPKVQMIHYSKLKPNPDNFYETPDIEKLAAAIRLAGEIKNPLRVHKTDIDEYEVNEGHRRRLATIYNVEQMGLKEFEFVPCVVEKNDTTIEKINLILSNSTQRERTEYEKMQEADKLRKLLDKYAKENETKISSTDMRKLIASILGVSGTKVAQLESINRNLVDDAKKKFEKGEIPVSVANEMASLPEKIQEDLSSNDDIKLSKVKEIKEDSKTWTKCRYDESKRCRVNLVQKYPKYLKTEGPCPGCCRICNYVKTCRYHCENLEHNKNKISESQAEIPRCAYDDTIECHIAETIKKYKPNRNIAECPGCCNLCSYTDTCGHVCAKLRESVDKMLTEKDLDKITFTFQDVKLALSWVKKQIPQTKQKDEETAVRIKVMSEALKKYLKEMMVVIDYEK